MSRPFDCDVLVVGLGPVGAALGALLVDESLSVIAIDKETDVYPLPRAARFDHEIMRLFQQLGVADEVAKHARGAPAYEFRNAAGEVLMRFELDRGRSPSGWPASFMSHQPGLENALRARLPFCDGWEEARKRKSPVLGSKGTLSKSAQRTGPNIHPVLGVLACLETRRGVSKRAKARKYRLFWDA